MDQIMLSHLVTIAPWSSYSTSVNFRSPIWKNKNYSNTCLAGIWRANQKVEVPMTVTTTGQKLSWPVEVSKMWRSFTVGCWSLFTLSTNAFSVCVTCLHYNKNSTGNNKNKSHGLSLPPRHWPPIMGNRHQPNNKQTKTCYCLKIVPQRFQLQVWSLGDWQHYKEVVESL